MTTKKAEKLYEAKHEFEMCGKKPAIYNPGSKEIKDLPIIYGFNNGGSPGWLNAVLLAEDGTVMGGHVCSSEVYMPHDLGILEGTRPDRHENFKKHYPNGYRMMFVHHSHIGLEKAYELNQKKREESEKS